MIAAEAHTNGAKLQLRAAGYRLAILSNGDRDMLQAAGPHIGFRFDHVISVQDAGYFKPHWKTYARAAEIIGLDRSSILFVANHAFDCSGAKSWGMRTAFHRPPQAAVWPDAASPRPNRDRFCGTCGDCSLRRAMRLLSKVPVAAMRALLTQCQREVQRWEEALTL